MVAADERTDRTDRADPLVPLTPRQAASRALTEWFEGERLDTYLQRTPDLSWSAPGGEFIIGASWRRRAEAVCIVELRGHAHRRALLARCLDRASATGMQIVIPSFDEMERAGSFYRLAGFEPVEEIVRFERTGVMPPATAPVFPTRAIDLTAAADLDALVRIDHAAFPWLWWNSADELRWYDSLTSTRLLFALDQGRPVGYAGYSVFFDDGHLDRLAVLPECAGQGHGASLLREVFAQLGRMGVRRVALTTQGDNARAQRLYRRFGFRRTSMRYRLYGRWLDR